MSTFKLIALPLFILIIGLTSSSVTYANNSMVVNESVESLSMLHRVRVKIMGGDVASVNTSVNILSRATLAGGTLTSLKVYVNGVMVGSTSNRLMMSSYTPTTPGSHSVSAVATYSNGIVVADVKMLNVAMP